VTNPVLPRVVGPWRFALIIVAITIGTAIFRVPSVVAANTGSSQLAVAIWVLGAVFAFAGGLCAAEVGSRIPGAGGEYAIIRTVYGDRTAFVYGWSWLLLVSPAAIAAVARTFADYAGTITPLGETARRLLTVVIIVLHAGLAMISTRIASRFVGGATIAKVAAMLIVAGAAFLFSASLPSPATAALPANSATAGAVIAAMVAVIWAYDGTAQVTMAGDLSDPDKTIPRGLILGTTLVVAIYLVMVLAYQRALGFAGVAGSEAVVADTMGALAGPKGAVIVAGMVMLSSYSCGMAQLVSHPRVTFALSADRMFFPAFATLSRSGAPWLAVALHGGLACGLALAGGYEFLFRLVVFAFYPIVAAGYIGAVLLRRREGVPSGFRMPWYPLPLVVYLMILALVLAVSVVDDPVGPLGSLAVMALGWLVHRQVVEPRRLR